MMRQRPRQLSWALSFAYWWVGGIVSKMAWSLLIVPHNAANRLESAICGSGLTIIGQRGMFSASEREILPSSVGENRPGTGAVLSPEQPSIEAEMRTMKLKKNYTFLYMPEDHGASRQFRLPRWLVVSSVMCVVLLGGVAALYGVGVKTGNSWLPGGSRFQQENLALQSSISGLEGQVDNLRQEIDEVYEVQNVMASAINLPTMDEETFAAGVGGRQHLDYTDVEISGFAGGTPAGDMGEQLDQMLRQAKIQRQGYLAMIDTLSSREVVRAHIPSIRPTDIGWMSSRFGFRKDPFTAKQTFHRGLDFSVPLGTDVRVTGDGVVAAVQQQRGFGRVVKIDHGNGVMTVYAHLSEPLVKKGDTVKRGTVIAKSCNTGRSSAPHLHYEIRIGGRPVNPLTYILDSYAARQ